MNSSALPHPNSIIPKPRPRNALTFWLPNPKSPTRNQIWVPEIVCVPHFTTTNVPQIGRARTIWGAESIKLDYVMLEKKFQKKSMKMFF